MKAKEADQVGRELAVLVREGELEAAHALLAPILARRTPFRYLDRIGRGFGTGPLPETNRFLKLIASKRTEGGWVVIGSALGQQLDRDPEGAFARCRAFIIAADVWYGADILGERVPGPAMVAFFETALGLLTPWREDEDRWVRRATCAAVHCWAKRSRGSTELVPQAEALLAFLDPIFEDWEMDVAKSVGWGLKTLGCYYPDLVTGWLEEQVTQRGRRHRAVVLRKAVTYLSDEQRARASGAR